MSLKIDANTSKVAYHITDGPFTFPYAIDANHAVAHHPREWSHAPWSREDEVAARREAGQPEVELSPEEQAAIDDHAKAVAEANERLKVAREKAEAKRLEAEQVAADEALVASAPPRPDPAVRRPFGRKGEPTKAEIAAAEKQAARKAADDKLVRDKAAADAQYRSE